MTSHDISCVIWHVYKKWVMSHVQRVMWHIQKSFAKKIVVWYVQKWVMSHIIFLKMWHMHKKWVMWHVQKSVTWHMRTDARTHMHAHAHICAQVLCCSPHLCAIVYTATHLSRKFPWSINSHVYMFTCIHTYKWSRSSQSPLKCVRDSVCDL